MRMLYALRTKLRALNKEQRNQRAQHSFEDALKVLDAGDLVIDLGANVGAITGKLADQGCTVHAFEPDPDAFAALKERFSRSSQVILINEAVSDHAGQAQFFFHKKRIPGSTDQSESSSLSSESHRLNDHASTLVNVCRFTDYLKSLEVLPTLVKMDIEGAEVEVLEDMLKSDLISKIRFIFVETHEKICVSKRKRIFNLIDQLKRSPGVNLDWH